MFIFLEGFFMYYYLCTFALLERYNEMIIN
jgi:hypothetical protein